MGFDLDELLSHATQERMVSTNQLLSSREDADVSFSLDEYGQ